MPLFNAPTPDKTSPDSLSEPTSSTAGSWLWATVVCVAGAVLAFLLPLVVPTAPAFTISNSYSAGFNNTVAVLGVVGLSVLVVLGTLWWRRSTRPQRLAEGEPIDGAFLLAVLVLSALVLAFSGWLVTASHLRYIGDAGYFIEQATVRRDTGRVLYTQLEFCYGPLLLLPEVWLSKALGCSMYVAYFITLIVESTAGLLLLTYVLNRLPIRTQLRRIGLGFLAAGALTPHLGLNYTFLRFVTPYALLLFATRGRSLAQTVLWLSLGEAAILLISPELGLALAVGICVFGLLRAWQAGWPWLAAAVVPVGVMASLLLTLGRTFLVTAASFTHGTLNLPVGPYPHLLVLLFALVWLVPFGLGCTLDLRDPASAPLLAVYATAVAFIPAALGRSDPLHVFFNGVGVLLLALVVVSRSPRPARLAWVAAFAVLVLWSQFVSQRFFQLRTVYLLAQNLVPGLPAPLQSAFLTVVHHRGPAWVDQLTPQPETAYHLDTSALDGIVGHACVTTPAYVSPIVEADLKQAGHYSPGYYAFWINMMNPTAEQRDIHDARQCPWMLLPTQLDLKLPPLNSELADLQGYRLPYALRHASPYHQGAAFMDDVRQHWRAVRPFGPYTLYRQAVSMDGAADGAALTASPPRGRD